LARQGLRPWEPPDPPRTAPPDRLLMGQPGLPRTGHLGRPRTVPLVRLPDLHFSPDS